MGLFKRKPYVPTGRVGLLFAPFEGTGYSNKGLKLKVQVQVEEIEKLGTRSRLKVLDVMGVSDIYRSQAWNLVDGIYFPTDQIEWQESNG